MALRYLPKFYPNVSDIKKTWINDQINIVDIQHQDEIVYRIQCYLGVSNDLAQKIVESYFETMIELLFNNNKVKLSIGYLMPEKKYKKINIKYIPINIEKYE
jgi:hypothetical protein